ALLDAGYEVRVLVRPCHPEQPRSGDVEGRQDVEIITGDMRETGKLTRALDGCRFLVHTAALYSFAPRDRSQIHTVNVTGTAGLMTAAYVAGVERVVLTSSSATIGHARNGTAPDESCYPDTVASGASKGDYHHSKLLQERAAFAGRVPVVAVLPTAPVGPGDWKPTPTGKLILDFLNGRITAKAPGRGGMNLVAVEDVAFAHVAALQKGRTGERYVIGGENLTMDQIWEMLAEITGKPMPKWRAPYALALAAAYVDEIRCRLNPNATPLAPLEGVRMSRERMYADSSKATRELEYRPTPIRSALERAVAWYRAAT
ncbi:MAG: NAD-dependent epimerase/dehydratase family protein, partial [Candidatus Eremiobacteraeota bacterium]|nr:NAD-dependent epimerase/dehydratase family protein [Candidatus Eremiobacteraeota bacterium]